MERNTEASKEAGVVLPIAEAFDSIQGEGSYAGTRMFFIRTAGCTVGKYDPDKSPFETCTTWDGRPFTCDTNYKMRARYNVSELMSLIPDTVMHVCLTGGEPLMHDLSVLMEAIIMSGRMVHVETSGTIFPDWLSYLISRLHQKQAEHAIKRKEKLLWIAVSPKADVIKELIDIADEVKLLVDGRFDPNALPIEILLHQNVFVQPINGIETISEENLKLAVRMVRYRYPEWKLSMQAHKIWRVR